MADTEAPAAATNGTSVKPQRPDQAAFRENMAKIEKENQAILEKLSALEQHIQLARGGKDRDPSNPVEQRRQELIQQLNEIRKKQGVGKDSRASKKEHQGRLEAQLRSRIDEQKTSRARVPFKSTQEIDDRICQLEKEVEGGRMRIVDEKKALNETSNLKKWKKSFVQFDADQKNIDGLRERIKEIKDSLNDPESSALNEQYNKFQAELDTIKAEQNVKFKNLNGLRDEKAELQMQQRQKYAEIKKLRLENLSAWTQFKAWEAERYSRQREREKAERERIEKDLKKERAEKMLEEARFPAYQQEIGRANNLLYYFDPSCAPAEKAPLLLSKGLGAEASRKVDDSAMQGMKVLAKKKGDDDDEYMPAKKGKGKGKKGKKAPAADKTDKAGGFSLPPSIIDDCAAMNINPPMSSADITAVVEKIKAKLDHWKDDQDSQTKRNVEKAEKEIERLNKEDDDAKQNGDNPANPVETAAATNKADETAEKAVPQVDESVESVTAQVDGVSLGNEEL